MTEMLTSKDMQTLLQVDRSTIYRMAEAGRLPAIKIGKQWRFPGDQVEQWLNAKAGSTPQPSAPAPQAEVPANGSLEALLPLECVQLIVDTFADTLGVMLVVTDMSGHPVTQVSHPCGLFEAISDVPNAVQKCVESWRSLATKIELEPKFMPSHLGLLCARGMIRVGTELKGMVVVGGIAPRNWPPSPQQIEEMAATFGVTGQTLATHINEVFYMDNLERENVLPYVQRIANIIAHIVNERNSLMSQLNV